MKDLLFRKMTKADLTVVTKIESECQSCPWTLLQFLDGFNAGHDGWVACNYLGDDSADNEMIVAFAVVSKIFDEGSLLNICVRPAYQKQGLGRKFLSFLLAKAESDKLAKIFLEVRASNKPAINLYESMAFKKISVRKDYYPALVGREDGLVYVIELLAGG